jgi:hypothetical protein
MWRSRHRQVTLIALAPLMLTVTTATAYRVLHSVFGVERSAVRFFVQMHQGTWFGVDAVLYTGLNAALTLCLVLSALPALVCQVRRLPAKSATPRDWHKLQSLFSAALLVWACVTGFGYRFLRNVAQLEKDEIGWLIDCHHLNVLGGIGSTIYCVAAFSLLCTAVISGVQMHPKLAWIFPRSNPSNADI